MISQYLAIKYYSLAKIVMLTKYYVYGASTTFGCIVTLCVGVNKLCCHGDHLVCKFQVYHKS